MSAYFVTSTGTDIGKTFVTAGLIRHLRGAGATVDALKPLVSGYTDADGAASDPGRLLAALGEAATPQTVARLSPWRFTAPLSPDMAAAREGRDVDVDALVAFCRARLAANTGTLFVEGVGGILVPLDARRTVRDWMVALDLPLILVAGSYLGTLSHTLSALEVIAAAGLRVAAVVVNESAGSTVPLDETAATLARFATDHTIVTLPRDAGPAAFAALAKELVKP
jgi:dethiobiotin synthetase